VANYGPFRESIGIDIDTSAVGPYFAYKGYEIRAALAEKMMAVSTMLQSKIVGDKLSGQLLNRRTGKLSDSVRVVEVSQSTDTIEGGVTAGGGVVDYARSLEYGSQAHDIVPRTKQALAFMIDGKMIFAKRVHHPGTRAYAFMRGTLDEYAATIQAEFQSAAKEAAEA
jgi:hypothetical protein